jgi:hypothetical protein
MSRFDSNASKVGVIKRVKELLDRAARGDADVKQKVDKANEALVRLKALSGATHVDSTLSSISVQYRNEDFIGSRLMPTVMVPKKSNTFFKYSKRDILATPDDSMSNRSTANEVNANRSTDNYSVKPYALANTIDASELHNQDAPLNEMVDLVALINDQLALAQEKRHATVLTTAANYAGNTATKAGTTQWSDYTTYTESPAEAIAAARDAIWNPAQGPSRLVGFTSRAVFNKLRRHPTIITDFKHQSGLRLPTAAQLAEYFELDELLIGGASEDTANEGQSASYGRIWGKDFGIVRVAQSPGIRHASFGYTFQFENKFTWEQFDPEVGVKGGYRAKVGWEVDEKVVAPDTGYLLKAVIA